MGPPTSNLQLHGCQEAELDTCFQVWIIAAQHGSGHGSLSILAIPTRLWRSCLLIVKEAAAFLVLQFLGMTLRHPFLKLLLDLAVFSELSISFQGISFSIISPFLLKFARVDFAFCDWISTYSPTQVVSQQGWPNLSVSS